MEWMVPVAMGASSSQAFFLVFFSISFGFLRVLRGEIGFSFFLSLSLSFFRVFVSLCLRVKNLVFSSPVACCAAPRKRLNSPPPYAHPLFAPRRQRPGLRHHRPLSHRPRAGVPDPG